jgi:hypothetical protein
VYPNPGDEPGLFVFGEGKNYERAIKKYQRTDIRNQEAMHAWTRNGCEANRLCKCEGTRRVTLRNYRGFMRSRGLLMSFRIWAITKWVLVGDEPGREEASGEEVIDKQSRREGTCAAADAPKEKIVAAALQRLTAEAYLLLDPKAGTSRER